MVETTRTDPAPVSARASAVPASKIREMFDLANEVDRDLVRLEVGEPDFDTPAHVIERAHAAALDGETHYTSTLGIAPLREAIADKMENRSGRRPDPADEVVVCNGAMEALLLGLYAVSDVGDEVVVPTPAWPNYEAQCVVTGCAYVPVPTDPDAGFALDADAMVEAIGPDTAAVIMNRPCNPTGRLFEASAVRAVLEAAADHGAYVIADEIYEGLVYDGSNAGVAAMAPDPDRVLTVNGCSKQYAMTGWRLGWLTGPASVVTTAGTLHQATTSCASSVGQFAALAALTGDQAPAEAMYAAFAERRQYVLERVAAIDAIGCAPPDGTFYAFLDVRELADDSAALARELLFDHGVVTAPGVGFGPGGEGFLRISFATGLDRLAEGFDRLERFVAEAAG